MLKRCAPMSNTERQRRFRERNPGYYGRLHRQRKAEVAALRAKLEWCKAFIEVKTQLMLPSPDQVSCKAGAELLEQIGQAATSRELERAAVERAAE